MFIDSSTVSLTMCMIFFEVLVVLELKSRRECSSDGIRLSPSGPPQIGFSAKFHQVNHSRSIPFESRIVSYRCFVAANILHILTLGPLLLRLLKRADGNSNQHSFHYNGLMVAEKDSDHWYRLICAGENSRLSLLLSLACSHDFLC